MEKLPYRINTHIFRSLSHPVADATRDRITEFQSFGSSDLHTFFIVLFLQRKLNALPELLDEMHELEHRQLLLPSGSVGALREPIRWVFPQR